MKPVKPRPREAETRTTDKDTGIKITFVTKCDPSKDPMSRYLLKALTEAKGA